MPEGPILFDLDGTLVDDRGATEAYLSRAYSLWADHLPHDEDSFRHAWSTALSRHFQRYLDGHVSFVDQRRARVREVFQASTLPDEIVEQRVREFVEMYEDAWRLFDDVLVTLDALADRALGVITNGSELQQLAKLERLGVSERFTVVVTSEAVGIAKPAVEIFAHAAQQLGVKPSACTVVGDDWRCDVEGALGAQMAAIWLDREDGTSDIGDPRVTRIATLAELA